MFIWTVVFFLFIWKFGESSGNHRSPECPNLNEKWHDFGGEYCYFIETEKKVTWYEAQYQCMRRGGNLASIHSERVGSMIQPYVRNKGYSLFVGLLRLITDENTFVWADGSDVDYINWNKNEPNWMDEKCGEILTDTMKWNDVMCHNKMGYICSVKKALPKVQESPKRSDCPTDKEKAKEKGYTVHACENNQLTLSCEEGRVIHVIRANYGRLSTDICNDDGQVQWSGEDCMAYSSFSIVNDRCGQKKTCTVEASTRVFGDQCPGTIKYLEVHYDCLPPYSSKSKTVFCCENYELYLSCEKGQVIHIIRANYGRLTRDLCNDDSAVYWSGEDCMANNSFSILNDRCEEKRKCTVKASNSIFGDPCSGTIKYLEVEHTCVPPDTSKPTSVFSCENNELHLSCEEGLVIHIIQANFGRLNRSLCNDDGKVQWSGEDCMANNSLSILNDRCEHKEKCTVKASNSIFGDPCGGTIKYLEVQHTCVPPDSSKPKTVYTCENTELNLGCEDGRVLQIIRANYGRVAREFCNDDGQVWWSGEDCIANNSYPTVRDRCEQKQRCTIRASNSNFGDPCHGTIKYLEVQYTCAPSNTSMNLPDFECPKLSEKWFDFDGEYCYFIETINKLNWYQASFECMRRGGSLASIHSEKESLMIHQFVRDTEYSLFIGLIRLMTDENIFVWSDGSVMNYQNWNANEPNWMDEKCGEVLTGNMKWNDVMCHSTLGYICSVRKVSTDVTECLTECNCPTPPPCDCPTSPKVTEISTQCDCPTLSNRTENLNHIDCPNGISYEIVISVAVCILLAVVLIGTGISCFRSRRQRRNRSSSTVRIQPPVPSSHRPVYFTSSDPFMKDENNYYEHMN